MARAICMLSLATAMISSVALAQAPKIPQAVIAYTATADHIAAAMNSIRPYYGLLPSCVPGTAKRIGLDMVQPVTMDDSGALTGGAWVEHVKVDGCSTSGIFNVYTQIRPSETPVVGGLLPGTTRASLELQRDALPTARQIATTKLPTNCNDIHAVDTKFDSFGKVFNADVPAGRDARSWREEWSFIGCGQPASVVVHFIPDRSGTTFTADQ